MAVFNVLPSRFTFLAPTGSGELYELLCLLKGRVHPYLYKIYKYRLFEFLIKLKSRARVLKVEKNGKWISLTVIE